MVDNPDVQEFSVADAAEVGAMGGGDVRDGLGGENDALDELSGLPGFTHAFGLLLEDELGGFPGCALLLQLVLGQSAREDVDHGVQASDVGTEEVEDTLLGLVQGAGDGKVSSTEAKLG